MVNWETCCQPLMRGGIGLKKLVPQNTAFMMKLAYQVVTKLDLLWVRILRSKYKLNEICPTKIDRQVCSFVWRSSSKVWPLFRDRISWSFGNGESVSFFFDIWIPNLGPLCVYILPGEIFKEKATVSEFVIDLGGWNWGVLRDLFSSNILDVIRQFILHAHRWEETGVCGTVRIVGSSLLNQLITVWKMFQILATKLDGVSFGKIPFHQGLNTFFGSHGANAC